VNVRERTNNFLNPFFQAVSESYGNAADQAIALLSDSIFVILPFREVRLVDFKVRRKLRLRHLYVLAQKPHVFPLQPIGLTDNCEGQRPHQLVQMRNDYLLISAMWASNDLDTLQGHIL
jgi:hypothetical protein